MTIKSQTRKAIVNYFSKKPEVAAVYLYGSYARGDARPDSDIDLGVLFTKKQNNLDFFALAPELCKLTGKKIEIQDLESCRVDFAHRVLSEGKLLTSNNEKIRIKFEEKVLRNYFDLKPALDEYYRELSEITKRGELGVRYIEKFLGKQR